jgi:uncharacterized protein
MQTKQKHLSIRSYDEGVISGVLHSLKGDFRDTPSRKLVVMLHGIFSDKDERGRFIRLADRLVSRGCNVLRVDFRGHGEHSIRDKDTTISGMVVDVSATLDFVRKQQPKELSVIASSFGASVLLLYFQSLYAGSIDRLVLLNPVVDYRATMLEATLEWGKNLFSQAGYDELRKTGYITLEEGFKMKVEAVVEMSIFRPYETFNRLTIPTLVLHGDHDSKVPYNVTKSAVEKCPCVTFHTIHGAEHAFKTEEHERETFELTTDWICKE